MTVKELIAELSLYAHDAEVRCVIQDENPFENYEDLNGTYSLNSKDESIVYITHS